MDIVLNTNSEEPIYNQIYLQISSQIMKGQLLPGEQLPPIRSIANELRISVIPVKMAWEMLDREGFIKTITGRGTFVAELHVDAVNEKLSTQAKMLAKTTAQKALDLGIKAEEFIGLFREEYKNVSK